MYSEETERGNLTFDGSGIAGAAAIIKPSKRFGAIRDSRIATRPERENLSCFGRSASAGVAHYYQTAANGLATIRESRIATRQSVGISPAATVGSQGAAPIIKPSNGLAAIRDSRIATKPSMGILACASNGIAGAAPIIKPSKRCCCVRESQIGTRQSVGISVART